MLTRERVLYVLDYDRETGVFTWKGPAKNHLRPGDPAGALNQNGHRQIKICGKPYMAHRLAWLVEYGQWPEGEIDHINRNPDDNRIENLRVATRSQNCANRGTRSDNTSGLKGVHRDGLRWVAQGMVNGKQKYLGAFHSKEEAHAAYMAATKATFGEFAEL